MAVFALSVFCLLFRFVFFFYALVSWYACKKWFFFLLLHHWKMVFRVLFYFQVFWHFLCFVRLSFSEIEVGATTKNCQLIIKTWHFSLNKPVEWALYWRSKMHVMECFACNNCWYIHLNRLIFFHLKFSGVTRENIYLNEQKKKNHSVSFSKAKFILFFKRIWWADEIEQSLSIPQGNVNFFYSFLWEIKILLYITRHCNRIHLQAMYSKHRALRFPNTFRHCILLIELT